jgi:uncharacterized membrane protein
MQNAIEQYFINPIFDRTGYNMVNTLAYAAIAIAALYLIWRFMRGKKYDFSSNEFLWAVSSFVLFGSTCRVLTDLKDSGADLPSIFTYGYLTVTPGIYIVTAVLFLASLAIGRVMKNHKFASIAGFVLWLPCIVLLLPFARYYQFLLLAVGIAAAGAIAAYFILALAMKRKLELHERLAIGGQALDGAATFVVIDVFGPSVGKNYFEQHVLSAGIGDSTMLGYFLFFLIKIALSCLIVYFLSKEKLGKSDSALILIVVGIMGFAPGLRDSLRMLVGS